MIRCARDSDARSLMQPLVEALHVISRHPTGLDERSYFFQCTVLIRADHVSFKVEMWSAMV